MKPQTERIAKALLAGERLTTLDALRRHSCARLPARVDELRKAGMLIASRFVRVRNAAGEMVRVKEYWCAQ